MKRLKIGLLPLYIKLYDDVWPEARGRMDSFAGKIVRELEKRGLDVVCAEVCRIKPEFETAIGRFEKENADAIVTLHLAYSPSLESVDALAGTELPLIVLDTTPTFDYSPAQDPDELLYNHGIHGVQDMCNLLLRRGKEFLIEAGHWAESDVLDRVTDCVKAAGIAGVMKKARVGRIGSPFKGMGDFQLPEDVMSSTIGIRTIPYASGEGSVHADEVSDGEIELEMSRDRENFRMEHIDEAVHRKSTRACLAVRKWVERNRLTAFTVNFMEITRQSGVSCMPFMEAGKAMAQGTGYAGEGDVLTAAMVGALMSVYPETSFTEMFCPDWNNDSIFLSHMGEMNLSLTAGQAILRELDFPYTAADNPIVAYGRFKQGDAVFVNLAPGRDCTYTLIVSPVEMLDVKGIDRMEDSIHGWMKPCIPLPDFLSSYSRAGGTHHGAIAYGASVGVLEAFAGIMRWRFVKL